MAPQRDARWNRAGTVALNSERIRSRYGSCAVRVLEQRDTLRQTGLFSNDADGATCRTFAIVRFAAEIPAALSSAHGRIIGGDSIGVSLADAGLPIARRTLAIEALELDTDAAALLDIMRIEAPAAVALHVYRLELDGPESGIPYATIAELHHPSYLDEAALRKEFGSISRTPADTDSREEMIALVRQHLSPLRS